MNQEAEKPSQRAEHFVRKLATSHAKAFHDFGHSLEQFGAGKIGPGGVIKVAADLYFREVAKIASELIGAVSEAWDWGLARVEAEADAAGVGGHHTADKETPKPSGRSGK
jgi:hypothetical protein